MSWKEKIEKISQGLGTPLIHSSPCGSSPSLQGSIPPADVSERLAHFDPGEARLLVSMSDPKCFPIFEVGPRG